MLKKTRFYIGLTLLVQSLSLFAMFIMLYSKKRSVTGALLAIASVGGLAGACLIYAQLSETMAEKIDTAVEDLVEEQPVTVEDIPHRTVEIPRDKTVNDAEFSEG
ncbi:MAG: hypothetical protein GX628_07665 [Clostridiales bacterium]|nr:hypothetical protein [Clostridiales bacterium]